MTTTIKLPRAHKKRLKAFDSLNEVNRWGSDVDARIDEIINSLGTAQRAIRELDRASGAASLGAHAATHRPASGSDPLSTAAPTSILGGTSSNSVGVGDSFARNDHSHDVGTAAPSILLGTAAAEGVSNNLVRIDATIVAFDVTTPANISVSAAATGSAAFAARRDHVHLLVESSLTLGNLGGTLDISKGGTGQTSALLAFAALSPANTKGDLIGHDGAVQGRLPVGTNGQILRADSTATFGFAWQNASFNENIFEVFDNLDNTKILQFNPGAITTGNTRTLNVPDANGTIALLNGQLGATAAVTDVRGIRTTTGPTLLTIGAVADGEFLKRVGATVVGAAAGAGSPGPTGPVGPPGDDGVDGEVGPTGPPGTAGAAGSTGAQGPMGPAVFLEADSMEGDAGPPGATGVAGVAGAPGAQGIQGPLGPAIFLEADPGEEGMIGPPGPQGPGPLTLTAFEKDLGASRSSGTFDITGLSGLTAGKPVLIMQTAAQIASKGNARDEPEWDQIQVTGYVVDAATIRVYWQAPSVVVGTYAFAYAVSA